MTKSEKNVQCETPLVANDKKSTIEKNNNEAEDGPVVPDGGWGWVVTFSSFMISFLVDGVCFTFGIFFPEFLRYFGESKGKTALLGSVLNGSYLTVGKL